MTKIFEEIAAERKRQNEKWGEQNHPMRGISERFLLLGERVIDSYPQDFLLHKYLLRLRERCETKNIGWFDILMEEVCESFLESEPEKQREEMIQVAAVAVQIVEYLDRKIKEMNNAGK